MKNTEIEQMKEQMKEMLKKVKVKKYEIEPQNGPNPKPVNEDTQKVIDRMAVDGYWVDLLFTKTELITADLDGVTVSLKAISRDVLKGTEDDKEVVGTIYQVIDEDIGSNKVSFAFINKSNGYQDYYAINEEGEVIFENELTPDPDPEEGNGIEPQLSKYSVCKSICNNICSTSLKITFTACIAACVETGPGEIFCAPLCFLMQYAACKLGCSKICLPFK